MNSSSAVITDIMEIPYYLVNNGVLTNIILMCSGLMCLVYLYATWTYSYFRNLGIKGPRPSPFLGTLSSAMTEGIAKHDQSLYNMYAKEKVYGIYEGRLPVLMVMDINMVERILIKDFHSFRNRRSFGYAGSMLSKGLLGAQGKYWEHIHSIITDALAHDKSLKKIFSGLSVCTERLANYVTIQAEKGNSFNAQSLFTAYSTDVTACVFFDTDIDSIANPCNAYVRYTREILQLAYSHPIFILYFFLPSIANIVMKLGYTLIPARLSHFFTSLIEQSFRRRKENPQEVSNDFLRILMEKKVDSSNPSLMDNVTSDGETWSSKGLTVNEIVAQSVTLFIAAFDTTSLSLTLTSWHLARYPEVQNKVLQELDDAIGDQQELTFENVKDLDYLEMVISEVLRLYPPSVRNERKADRDVMIEGIFIPKDLLIAIPISAIHLDPKFWPEPKNFDPERFTPEAKAKRNPMCYQPFGAGPRGCVGSKLAMMEMKFLLASILRKVKFVTCQETAENIVMKKTGSNVPDTPIVLGVELRDW
ncbi:cytochrome P450 3A21-like [Tubulanus polymorphus]|uniref:cytochrome P450 3A21-like n=1 Tax=Tubulanus polymorphus TaxID=672921 RepID=UPI003DA5CC92